MNAPATRTGRVGKRTERLLEAIAELTREQRDWRWKDLAERTGMTEGGVISAVMRLRAYGFVVEALTLVAKTKIVVAPSVAESAEG